MKLSLLQTVADLKGDDWQRFKMLLLRRFLCELHSQGKLDDIACQRINGKILSIAAFAEGDTGKGGYLFV